MIRVEIPGRKEIELNYFVFDVNGTIACDGVLREPVVKALRHLSESGEIHAITADTFGNAREQVSGLDFISLHTISPTMPGDLQKAQLVQALGAASTVAFGNGRNDRLMFQAAVLSIGVISREGLYSGLIKVADLVVHDIIDGIELLTSPRRLIATLRD